MPFEAKETPRMGLIGAGGRGGSMLREWLAVENLRVTAVCDPVKRPRPKRQRRSQQRGQNAPAVYDKGETDFENLVKRDDVDFVYIATPWPWHVPPALAAMEHGKHALIEVPAAITLEDCWKMVDTSERTRRHCLHLRKLLLRLQRADGPEYVPRRHARRSAARRRRLPARPALAAVCRFERRVCGAANRIPSSTATSILRMAWGRWRTTWASIAATASTTWSR